MKVDVILSDILITEAVEKKRKKKQEKRNVREEKKPESKKFPFKCDFFHLLLVFKDEIVY